MQNQRFLILEAIFGRIFLSIEIIFRVSTRTGTLIIKSIVESFMNRCEIDENSWKWDIFLFKYWPKFNFKLPADVLKTILVSLFFKKNYLCFSLMKSAFLPFLFLVFQFFFEIWLWKTKYEYMSRSVFTRVEAARKILQGLLVQLGSKLIV